MTRLTNLVISAVLAAVTGACATDEHGNRLPVNDVQKGAIDNSGNRNREAIIDAAGGGIAGVAVSSYMDSQRKDFEQDLAPEVQAGEITIQKDNQNNLLITMTGQTAFDFDSATIKPGFYAALDKIANILARYDKTQLTITGYTDNVGSIQYNQTLSERRAKAVNDYLLNKGVLLQRLVYLGRGATSPRGSNATEEGRRLNRRVEIIIEPIVVEPQNQTPG